MIPNPGDARRQTRSRSRSKPRGKTVASRSEYDPWTRVFYIPRTVTFLVVGLVLLTYYSHAFDPVWSSPSSYMNQKSGVYAVVCVFLGYSAVQGTRRST
jgi:hypothetical protein